MNANETITDHCYRCDYNLVGIANDQPCPECGLLAERSRHVGDELHQSRPKWLRKLSVGTWLILLALVLPIAGSLVLYRLAPFLEQMMNFANLDYRTALQFQFVPADLGVVFLWFGFALISALEGYSPADQSDVILRRTLRLAPIIPVIAMTTLHLDVIGSYNTYLGLSSMEWFALTMGTIGCIPLPLLMAARLRGLARRAGSAHLAEHCLIVGVGFSLTLAYAFVYWIVSECAEQWGWGDNWMGRGTTSLVVMLIMGVSGALMILWGVYLLTRFAIAFSVASRKMNREWRRDDHSVISLDPQQI